MATSSTTLTMAEQLVPDEVWAAIQPLLPPKRPHPKGGRPWIEDRAVLGGIIYVLRAGVPWRLLPAKELGCGSGVTCWRRLRDWQAAGVWEYLHQAATTAAATVAPPGPQRVFAPAVHPGVAGQRAETLRALPRPPQRPPLRPRRSPSGDQEAHANTTTTTKAGRPTP
jgi:transposase